MASLAPASGQVAVPASRFSKNLTCAQVPIPANFDQLPILDRPTIASRIAAGELLIIHSPLVYKVPRAWLNAHPGGDLSILHYVGRDASNELEAYHSGHTVAVRMARWVCGRIEPDPVEGWRDMVPPVQLHKWPIPTPAAPQPPHVPGSHLLPEKVVQVVDSLADEAAKASAKGVLTADEVDPPLAPRAILPLTPAYQQHLRESQRAFHAHIQQLGLDTVPGPLAGYGHLIGMVYVPLALAFIYLYATAHSTSGYFAASVVLGLYWHQVTFVVHDADHTGLTGNWLHDRVCSILIAAFQGGLSAGWWADNHNVHHLVTNSPEHDPDIQHAPFLAISTKFFANLRSSYHKRVLEMDWVAKRMIPLQHKLYYVIMAVARFNLFAMSYIFLLKSFPTRGTPMYKLRLLELFGIVGFWGWYGGIVLRGIDGGWNRLMFVLVSFAVTSPLHVQIVLSHFSQPVSVSSEIVPHAELLESHMHRQLRTTMDISCPEYLDFLHGGLNFQTPHHLLPRIPRFRFRAVMAELEKWVEMEQALVKDRCWNGVKLKDNEGLTYKKMDFVDANRDVLGVLRNVARQIQFIGIVAEADAKGELYD